jgi:hypothetical protein
MTPQGQISADERDVNSGQAADVDPATGQGLVFIGCQDSRLTSRERRRTSSEAMMTAVGEFPDDPDVQTLYADAVMNTMAWDYWQKDGELKTEAEPIRRELERIILAHSDHAGAHHYYIHLMEGSPIPEIAEARAYRLGRLMPATWHIVHMRAHIYLRIGRCADAAEANVRAIAADEDYLAQCQPQALYPSATCQL